MWSMLSQAFWLPLNVMVYGWELLTRLSVGLQGSAAQQVDEAVSRLAYGLSSSAGAASRSRAADRYGQDQDLSGDSLKLVQYVVLFVKRGYEAAFEEKEELIWDSLTAQEFATWKIAQFMQHFPIGDPPDEWRRKDYPPQAGLPEDDKKYLRVYFRVLKRYPRQEFRFQERQVEVLGEIRDALQSNPEHEDSRQGASQLKGQAMKKQVQSPAKGGSSGRKEGRRDV